MRATLFPVILAWACAPTLAPDASLPDQAAPAGDEPAVVATAPAVPTQMQRDEPAVEATAPTQATMPPPTTKTPPPCDGISGDLARAVAGESAGLELDEQGRVQVSMSFGGEPPTLPEGCESELSAMGHIQAWCLPSALCDLAATEGISNVRSVHRADPKPD